MIHEISLGHSLCPIILSSVNQYPNGQTMNRAKYMCLPPPPTLQLTRLTRSPVFFTLATLPNYIETSVRAAFLLKILTSCPLHYFLEYSEAENIDPNVRATIINCVLFFKSCLTFNLFSYLNLEIISVCFMGLL